MLQEKAKLWYIRIPKTLNYIFKSAIKGIQEKNFSFILERSDWGLQTWFLEQRELLIVTDPIQQSTGNTLIELKYFQV